MVAEIGSSSPSYSDKEKRMYGWTNKKLWTDIIYMSVNDISSLLLYYYDIAILYGYIYQ